jgi:hypothetical protein
MVFWPPCGFGIQAVTPVAIFQFVFQRFNIIGGLWESQAFLAICVSSSRDYWLRSALISSSFWLNTHARAYVDVSPRSPIVLEVVLDADQPSTHRRSDGEHRYEAKIHATWKLHLRRSNLLQEHLLAAAVNST